MMEQGQARRPIEVNGTAELWKVEGAYDQENISFVIDH